MQPVMRWRNIQIEEVIKMGMTFENLTNEELCDLMCGDPEPEPEDKGSGMYQCFHCLHNTVVWDSDFDLSDMGYEGEGVVHVCHCTNCGAEIEYRVPFNKEEKDGEA